MAVRSKTKIYIALISTLLVGISLGWMANSIRFNHPMRSHHGGGGPDGVFRGLDEKQRKVFNEIRQARREQMRGEMEQLRNVSVAFDEAVKSGASAEVLRERYAKVVEARGKMDWAQFETMIQMRPHLLPEQIEYMQIHMKMPMPMQGHEFQHGGHGSGRRGSSK